MCQSPVSDSLAARCRQVRQFVFMPHIPAWQAGPPQPPLGRCAAFGAPFECAAKVEYWVVRWSVPQDGHWTASASPDLRTSFSKWVPQSSHLYSNIGMLPS
jgi:hypothetical protein